MGVRMDSSEQIKLDIRSFCKNGMKKIQKEILDVHKKIWEFAEPADKEYRSADALCAMLEVRGFQIRKGVCKRKTAFIASYGQGHPCIGFWENTMLCLD